VEGRGRVCGNCEAKEDVERIGWKNQDRADDCKRSKRQGVIGGKGKEEKVQCSTKRVRGHAQQINARKERQKKGQHTSAGESDSGV